MNTDKKFWRNRKAKKELARRLHSENPGLEVVHPHAAGIDVGNGAHYVAVRPDRDAQPVRRFECFTADLYRLADWLQTLVCTYGRRHCSGCIFHSCVSFAEGSGLDGHSSHKKAIC